MVSSNTVIFVEKNGRDGFYLKPICPGCGGCLPELILKQAVVPDDDGTSGTTTTTNETETPCPMCSCPKIDWDDIAKNEKAFCVLQKLIKTGSNEYNSLVLSFISAFSGSEPYHDIVFIVGNLDGAYGNFNSTVYPPVITLNSATIANRAPGQTHTFFALII